MAMQRTMMVIVARLLALVLGLAWGFFVAFNMVFSDVFGVGEMIWAVAYVLIAYGLLGVLLGALERSTSWRWAFWIAPPGLLLVLYMLTDDLGRSPYVLAVFFSVIIGSAVGGWIGAWLNATISARRGRDTGSGAPA